MKVNLVEEISHDLAVALVADVHRAADDRGARLAAVVVDRGGNVVASSRMDGAQLGAMSLAGDKAFTAVSFGMPTGSWTHSSAPGGSDWGLGSTLGGRAVVFPGGIPLYADGRLIGGLGVSGAASAVDEGCALLAAAANGLEGHP